MARPREVQRDAADGDSCPRPTRPRGRMSPRTRRSQPVASMEYSAAVPRGSRRALRPPRLPPRAEPVTVTEVSRGTVCNWIFQPVIRLIQVVVAVIEYVLFRRICRLIEQVVVATVVEVLKYALQHGRPHGLQRRLQRRLRDLRLLLRAVRLLVRMPRRLQQRLQDGHGRRVRLDVHRRDDPQVHHEVDLRGHRQGADHVPQRRHDARDDGADLDLLVHRHLHLLG